MPRINILNLPIVLPESPNPYDLDQGYCQQPFMNFDFSLSLCSSENDPSCSPNKASASCWSILLQDPDVASSAGCRIPDAQNAPRTTIAAPWYFTQENWENNGEMVCGEVGIGGQVSCATVSPRTGGRADGSSRLLLMFRPALFRPAFSLVGSLCSFCSRSLLCFSNSLFSLLSSLFSLSLSLYLFPLPVFFSFTFSLPFSLPYRTTLC